MKDKIEVKCLKTSFTKDKVYQASQSKYCKDLYVIKDDNGELMECNKNYFEVIEDGVSMKEYSLQEVLDTEGVEFKTKTGTIVYAEKGQLCLKLKVVTSEVKWVCPLTKEWLNAKFTRVQEPVKFVEAVASGRRIKVIHSNFVSTDRFMTVPEMLNCISRYSRPIELIEDGQWYIEDNE